LLKFFDRKIRKQLTAQQHHNIAITVSPLFFLISFSFFFDFVSANAQSPAWRRFPQIALSLSFRPSTK